MVERTAVLLLRDGKLDLHQEQVGQESCMANHSFEARVSRRVLVQLLDEVFQLPVVATQGAMAVDLSREDLNGLDRLEDNVLGQVEVEEGPIDGHVTPRKNLRLAEELSEVYLHRAIPIDKSLLPRPIVLCKDAEHLILQRPFDYVRQTLPR